MTTAGRAKKDGLGERRAKDEAGRTVIPPVSEADPEFEDLLAYLKASRGFDFSGYKRSSLMRRVDKEMLAVGIAGYGNYRDHLEVHPEEFERLFNTILINVTAFFRDAPSWEYLADEVIPRLLAARPSGEPIRVWSAGCASGQEAYSLAIVLAERLGLDAFRQRVKIYATDVDEEALAQARSASYTLREVQGIPPALLEKYFAREGGRYVFRQELRRALIFGRHDLLRDAPISRIDLLACRNTVMYFNAEAQAQIVARFHFAVSDGGYLLLGKAEMLFSHASLFQPLDLKRRVFVKLSPPGLRQRPLVLGQAGPEPLPAPQEPRQSLRDAAFSAGPDAQIVVGSDGRLALTNTRARALFRLSAADLGRPLQDLEISYRPVELRSCIEQAQSKRRPVSVKDVPHTAGGERFFLDALVVPLQEGSLFQGALVTFTDVTRYRQLSEEIQEASRELETAYEELQSTNEELETTNEELQSTVEELETTNEELQSTNEELETTNEELQSTNEELQTTNEELRARSEELNLVNSFLESILTSLRGGVIVLDRELRVQVWNDKSQDLWGLRADEVASKLFLTLDIGLPVDALLPAVRAGLADPRGHQALVTEARDRRGRTRPYRVSITPLVGLENDIHGIILLVEEEAGGGPRGGPHADEESLPRA